MENKQDKTLNCSVCKKDFIWPGQEQKRFDEMVISGKWKVATSPTRCPACRCRRIPMRADNYINAEAITLFVEEVETKKGYRRIPDLVLRHLFEEIGELSAALWKFEEESEFSSVMKSPPEPTKVARELVDIISLVVWLADIMKIDLNASVRWRMKEVSKQYGIEDRETTPK